jgi:hypothetical protein
MKLDLLTNATVVDDAIRFVSQKYKEKLKSPSSNCTINENDKESNKHGYDDDEDQLEDEQQDKTGKVTTNQVF